MICGYCFLTCCFFDLVYCYFLPMQKIFIFTSADEFLNLFYHFLCCDILKVNETFFFLKKIFYLFIFRERGKEGERGVEKHQCALAS